MLGELLAGGWLLTSCLIAGEVEWKEEHATAKLATECPFRYEVEHSRLKIHSKRWVVEIPIPHEQGIQSFQYRWGQAKAIVGEHLIEVAYGPEGGI